MAELNEQQIELISAYIRQHGVAQDDLHEDLLDHVCTSIERLMDDGMIFEQAFAKTIKLFGPGGLKQVQQQTFELLTEMNETMKKVAFVFGSTSAILLLAGTIFKLLHWPGAGIMIVLGGASLTLCYLPMLLIHKLKESPRNEALMHVSGFIGMALTALGVVFKIMHWPGAGFLLISGMSALGFLYVPIYFYKKYKTSSNKPVTFSASLVAMTCLVLVFALISVHPSAHFENGWVQINNQIDETVMQLEADNTMLYANLEGDETAQHLREETEALMTYIDGLKRHLMAEAQDLQVEQAESLTPQGLRDKQNLGTPIHILWESKPEDPHHVDQLRARLKDFRADALDFFPETSTSDVELFLPYSWVEDEEIAQQWMNEHFYRVQLSVVLAQLSQFQLEAQHAEQHALLYLTSRPAASVPPSGG